MPRFRSEARSPRPPRSWRAHAVLVALVLAAVGYVNITLHERADGSARMVTQIATLRGMLSNERDLQWRALARDKSSLEVARRLGDARREERRLIDGLVSSGTGGLTSLRAHVEEYHEALNQELAHITLNRTDQARKAEEDRTTPAYERLDRLLLTASDSATASSEQAHRTAHVTLAAALATVTLLLAGLLRGNAAAHRDAQRAADALLAQERAGKAALQREQELVRHQATHDPLTGLPNRLAFTEAVRQLQQEDGLVAVLYVDLDGFKAVNDGFGHAAGDEVLRAVASRLRAVVRPGEVAVRLGGDEFAVLARVPDAAAGEDLARRLGAALEDPPVVVGAAPPVGGSVGYVVGSGRDMDELLRRADAEMYATKSTRRRAALQAAAL